MKSVSLVTFMVSQEDCKLNASLGNLTDPVST